jgi:hypothetical protein
VKETNNGLLALILLAFAGLKPLRKLKPADG